MPSANSRLFPIIRNHTLADSSTAANSMKSYWLKVVQLLVDASIGGAWTVVGSSDGTTAGLDATNRWTDITKVIRAAAGVAHSWIVLQNATLGCYLLIDLIGGDNYYAANFKYGPNAPAGGSTTNAPTMAGNCDASLGTFSVQTSPGLSARAMKVHMSRATNGEFHILAAWGGHFTGHFILRKRSNLMGEDVTPGFWLSAYYNDNGSQFGWDTNSSHGPWSAADGLCTAYARAVDGNSDVRAPALMYQFGAGVNQDVSRKFTNLDTLENPQAWVEWPVVVANASNNFGQYLGKVPDIYWVSGTLACGNLNNQDGGTATRIAIHGATVPWDSDLAPDLVA